MPNITLDTTAARLEVLLERATKGPFEYMEGPNLIRALRGDLAVPLFEIREPYCDPDMPVPTVRLGDKVVCRANSRAARDSASRKQGRANGRFLLEVLNALPALLSERRELKEALAALTKSSSEYVNTGSDDIGFAVMVANLKRDIDQARALLTANGGEHD